MMTTKPPPGTQTSQASQSRPTPADERPQTVASVLGEITWLMSRSPVHKQFFISDLEWPGANATDRTS